MLQKEKIKTLLHKEKITKASEVPFLSGQKNVLPGVAQKQTYCCNLHFQCFICLYFLRLVLKISSFCSFFLTVYTWISSATLVHSTHDNSQFEYLNAASPWHSNSAQFSLTFKNSASLSLMPNTTKKLFYDISWAYIYIYAIYISAHQCQIN